MGGLDDIIKEAESTPSPRHKRRFNTTRTTIARKQ